MNETKHDGQMAVLSREASAALLERVVVGGDLSKLSAQERMQYYAATCASVGLNPVTRPFEYIYLQGKMSLYARKEATDQLRDLHNVNVTKIERELVKDAEEGDFYAVTAYATNARGRSDSSLGIVYLSGKHGDDRANAMMKAETKAKRRVTLSLCGLGVLDESEIDVPAGAQRVTEVLDTNPGGLPTHESVTTLFPLPEQDRAGLIQRAKIGVARMDKARVAKIKVELLGSAEAKYEDVDLSALVAFVQAVEVPL